MNPDKRFLGSQPSHRNPLSDFFQLPLRRITSEGFSKKSQSDLFSSDFKDNLVHLAEIPEEIHELLHIYPNRFAG